MICVASSESGRSTRVVLLPACWFYRMDFLCLARSSLPADKRQAATLGEAAGESSGAGDAKGLVKEARGYTMSFLECFLLPHLSLPWRALSSLQCQPRQLRALGHPCYVPGAVLAVGDLAMSGVADCVLVPGDEGQCP